MKEKTSHPILTIIIIILGISVCTALFAVVFQRFRSPEVAEELPPEPAIPGDTKPYNFDYTWSEKNPYIAHAFGGILGNSYTNSYEAFLLNYKLGHRVFEVDFYITDDGYTVAAHDDGQWHKSASIPSDAELQESTFDTSAFTYDNFMSSLWHDKYHPVDLTTLFELLQEYPDVYIVTDTKFSDEAKVRQQFSAFVEAANAIDPSLLDRFIIQIYNQEMLDWIMDVHAWKSIIYTLYQDPNWTPENVLTFSEASGVKFITMWDSFLTTDISNLWSPSDIKIATHTLNNLSRATDSRARGADVIYTDFLLP